MIVRMWHGRVPTAKADADRKAAEWVLSVGGKLWVNGQERDIKAAADLPKERFTLTLPADSASTLVVKPTWTFFERRGSNASSTVASTRWWLIASTQ